jgi:hypothetical protein
MKTLYSDQDRSVAVKNFISARYQGIAKVSSFQKVADYLNGKRIKPLFDIMPSGRTQYYVVNQPSTKTYYTESDGEVYFNWLINVVTGTEKASEDTIKEANDQLFLLILILRDSIQMTKQVQLVAPGYWESRLVLFDTKLTAIQQSMDNRDKEITEILSKIYDWLKEYTPILDEAKKDYDDQLEKVQKK